MRPPVQGDAPTKRPSVDLWGIWKVLGNLEKFGKIWKNLEKFWKNSGKIPENSGNGETCQIKNCERLESLRDLEIWEIWSVEQALTKR